MPATKRKPALDVGTEPAWCECHICRYRWIWAYLPAPAERVMELGREARCAKCGSRSKDHRLFCPTS